MLLQEKIGAASMANTPENKQNRSRCGANFGRAVTAYNAGLKDKPAMSINGMSLRPLKKDEFISFAGFKFEPGGIRDGFKVKPDAIYVRSTQADEDLIPTVAFEHCGAWQNFYQKRFLYMPRTLGLFQKILPKPTPINPRPKTKYAKIATLAIVKVIYLLPDTAFSRRIVRATPEYEYEEFSFRYSLWEEKRAFSPKEEVEHSLPWIKIGV